MLLSFEIRLISYSRARDALIGWKSTAMTSWSHVWYEVRKINTKIKILGTWYNLRKIIKIRKNIIN